MPPRRRKKPPDPTPLSLLFTYLLKKIPLDLECQLLGHISQFIVLGNIGGLASNSASISDRFRRLLSPTVKRFGIPKCLHTRSYVLRCHLCSSCPDSSGLNLPCPGLGCSSLGNCSSFQWRLLSLDRSKFVLLVVGGAFACYGCGRPLSPSSVPVIRPRGPRSATVKSSAPGWLFGSVSIALFYSFFLCKTQVCYYLPLLFYIVLMDYIQAFYLNALRNINSGSNVWNGLLRFNWLWCCLSLSWLIGVKVTAGVNSWFYSWHFREIKPHSLMYWDLVSYVYGLVFNPLRLSRITRLLLISPKLLLLLRTALQEVIGWGHHLWGFDACYHSWLLLSFALSTANFMIGCDDRVHVALPSAIPLCSWDHVFCPGSLVSRQLHLSETFPHRARIPISLIRFIPEQSETRFDDSINAVSWASPSLLLSFLLVILYAQNHDSKCYCFCWHLFHFQYDWAEVKGLYPLVYEGSFSETRASSLIGFGLIHVFSYIFCHCYLPFFRPDWDVNQGQWPFICVSMLAKRWLYALMVFSSVLITFDWSVDTGTRSLLFFNLPRPKMQLQTRQRVLGMQDQELGNSTFMFWLYFDMYWVYMIDLFLVPITIDKAVNWLSQIYSYLLYNCSRWFVCFVAQHCCVLGLCLMALELHRRMLGLAH